MTHYEGILVSWDGHVNSAAMGAEIEEENIVVNVYIPSNTYLNLKEEGRFTYSLTGDRELFYTSALTGHHDDVCELGCSDLAKKDDFYFPTKASRTYFCEVLDQERITERDEFGTADIFQFKGKILRREGDGDHLGREDPVIDALVHASRYHLGDKEQKERIRKKVIEILRGEKGDVARKVREYVGGDIDEV